MDSQSSAQPARLKGVAYPTGLHYLAAGLFAVSRLSLVVIAFMFFLGWVISPPLLVRLILFFSLIPALALILMKLVLASDCEISDGLLGFRRTALFRFARSRAVRLNIGSWRALSLPVPGPGVLIGASEDAGKRSIALESKQLTALLGALDRSGPAAASSLAQAGRIFSEVRACSRLLRWHWPIFKFGVFGLLPVFLVFRLHQNIMYGGLLGQYHLHGLGPWLSSLSYHWIMVTIYLVLYAAFWRSWVEPVCWLSARFFPSRAAAVRAWGEAFALAVYFAGIPLFVIWRSYF
ncbi:MAG: hypothetical protein JJU31_10795 [Wenzhouxiangella sp.]|nr:hypothetical protein [Wenzhouxiangella sp.]MCH8479152.1 hypothetical protein [Wenzhouxiangella sp.]TVR91940.1 MAG: hypothetical protein EA418_13730 [Wenzhouxiangellaceae bacterium]